MARGGRLMLNAGLTTRMSGSSYKQFGKEVLCTQIHFSMLEAMFEIDHVPAS